MITWNEHIKLQRTLRGWSLRQLAQASGVSDQTISRIERGEGAHTDIVGAIARSLGLSLNELYSGDLIRPPHPVGVNPTTPPSNGDSDHIGRSARNRADSPAMRESA